MFDPVKWRYLTVVSEISPVQISVHYLISLTEAESFITGQEPALSTDYESKCVNPVYLVVQIYGQVEEVLISRAKHQPNR